MTNYFVDFTGWHNRLNRAAGQSTPPFYSLITLLYQESEQVGETVRLVNGNQTIRRQRNSTTMEAKIFELWDR